MKIYRDGNEIELTEEECTKIWLEMCDRYEQECVLHNLEFSFSDHACMEMYVNMPQNLKDEFVRRVAGCWRLAKDRDDDITEIEMCHFDVALQIVMGEMEEEYMKGVDGSDDIP